MTVTYLINGRVIPESIDLTYVPDAPDDLGDIKIITRIVNSKIILFLEASIEISIPDLWNRVFSLIGNIINQASFNNMITISYDIDSMTNLNTQKIIVRAPQEPIFENIENNDHQVTFVRRDSEKCNRIKFANDRYVSRATFELRNSIRYPDFTAMHCRHAIEAIRNAFGAEDFPAEKQQQQNWEGDAWKKMREALNISESSLKSFNDIANEQRHGRNRPQTWEHRRACMQIAWETLHRFLEYLSNGKTKLPDSDYPELTMAYSPESNDGAGTQEP